MERKALPNLAECIGLFTSTHNEDPPCRDWFLACEIRLPFSPINWRPRISLNSRNSGRVRTTAYSSRIAVTGFGASLDAPEGSMLLRTLLPGA